MGDRARRTPERRRESTDGDGVDRHDPVPRPGLARAWRSGQIHSVVAVAPDGEVTGHIALTFDRTDDLVPEGGKLVVDPRYRGHHLAERLAAVRLDLARELGLSGI